MATKPVKKTDPANDIKSILGDEEPKSEQKLTPAQIARKEKAEKKQHLSDEKSKREQELKDAREKKKADAEAAKAEEKKKKEDERASKKKIRDELHARRPTCPTCGARNVYVKRDGEVVCRSCGSES